MHFDFLVDNREEPLIPEVVHHGPNGKTLKKLSRRDVIQDFLDNYQEMNGKEIMKIHMLNDPKFFGDVLKKMIPNQMNLDAGELMNIKVVDRFGNSLEVQSGGESPKPDRDLDPAKGIGLPQIEIRDRFGAGLSPTRTANAKTGTRSANAETATGSNPDFDFEL